MKKIKLFIVTLICVLTVSQSISQTILTKGNVKTLLNDNDTLIALTKKDAEKVLIDLNLYKEVVKESIFKDTLIKLYKIKNNMKDSIIFKQELKYKNCLLINDNNISIIGNKNKIIDDLNIEVEKQKRHKIIAIIGGTLTTILTIYMLH